MKKLWLAALTLAICGVSHAQVTSTTNAVSYACDGAAVAFPVTFKFLAPADLIVTQTPSGGAEAALLLGTDYTVTGGKDATGTVTTTARGACANTVTLKIARNTPQLQPINFRAQGNFSPSLHQTAFDRVTMAVQDLASKVSANAGPAGPTGAAGPAGPVDTTALTLAGSKTRVFYQASPPTNPTSGYSLQTGDLWFNTTTYVDTDGRTKTKYDTSAWNGSSWAATPNQALIVAKEIAAGAIVADNLAANAVTADKILGNTITGDKIAGNTITAANLSADAIKTSNYAEDGSGNPTAGAKLDKTGTALKVAAGNLQIGSTVFSQAVQFKRAQRIAGAISNMDVYFDVAFPDTSYAVSVTPVAWSVGTPTTGAWRVAQVTKYTGHVTVIVEANPGVSNWVDFDVLAVRY